VRPEIYCDGGVIARNPSEVGGTWAWCLVVDDTMKLYRSGVIVPVAGTVITNNMSELYAAIMAIETLPRGWDGTIRSDSRVTIGRISRGWNLRNVPEDLARLVDAVRTRLADEADLGFATFELVQGHPSREDLARGVGRKRNLPVSKWNVWCDRECNRVGAQYVAELSVKRKAESTNGCAPLPV
jgi:ribonuclease HI